MILSLNQVGYRPLSGTWQACLRYGPISYRMRTRKFNRRSRDSPDRLFQPRLSQVRGHSRAHLLRSFRTSPRFLPFLLGPASFSCAIGTRRANRRYRLPIALTEGSALYRGLWIVAESARTPITKCAAETSILRIRETEVPSRLAGGAKCEPQAQ